MNPPRRAGETNVDYALGQIDTKLGSITQTLGEDRLSDAQFRTWVREQTEEQNDRLGKVEAQVHGMSDKLTDALPRIRTLEDRAIEALGSARTWQVVGKLGQALAGAIGGLIALLVERIYRGH